MKVKIEGMSCNHCVSSIQKKISNIEGVNSVDVNFDGKYANIEGENVDPGYVVEQINALGYNATL